MASAAAVGCNVVIFVSFFIAFVLLIAGTFTSSWLVIPEEIYETDLNTQQLLSNLRKDCFGGVKTANYSVSVGLFHTCFGGKVGETNPCVRYSVEERQKGCHWMTSSDQLTDYLFNVYTLDKTRMDEFEMPDWTGGLQVVFCLILLLYLCAGGVLVATLCGECLVSTVNLYAVYSCLLLTAAMLTIGGCAMFGSSLSTLFDALKYTRMLQCGFPCPDETVKLTYPTLRYTDFLGHSIALSLLSLLPVLISAGSALLRARAAAHRSFVHLYGVGGHKTPGYARQPSMYATGSVYDAPGSTYGGGGGSTYGGGGYGGGSTYGGGAGGTYGDHRPSHPSSQQHSQEYGYDDDREREYGGSKGFI